MSRKTKEMGHDQKRPVISATSGWIKKKTEFGKICSVKFLKRFDAWENIEKKPRSTSKQGTLIRLVKHDRKRSLRDLINEFSQSDLVPIC